jgi:hypothetical protein
MPDSTLYLELGQTERGTVTPLLAVTDPVLIAEVGRLIAKRLGAADPTVDRVLALVPTGSAR